MTQENGDPQETFFQKNKKIILISLAIFLAVGAIVGIILAIVLKGKDGPNPDQPVEPDPYVYQEFNPFYVDPDQQPEVNTFSGKFYLKYNSSAFPNNDQNQTNVTSEVQARRLQQLESFLGGHENHVKDSLNGTIYRPMNPRYVENSTNNTWAQNAMVKVEMNSNNQARVVIVNEDTNQNETQRRLVNSKLFPRPKLEIEARLQQAGFKYNTTGSFAFNFTDIYTGETLVTTMFRKMVLTHFYSELGFVLPTQRCFGLGQRNGKFQLDQGTYTFNSRAHD